MARKDILEKAGEVAERIQFSEMLDSLVTLIPYGPAHKTKTTFEQDKDAPLSFHLSAPSKEAATDLRRHLVGVLNLPEDTTIIALNKDETGISVDLTQVEPGKQNPNVKQVFEAATLGLKVFTAPANYHTSRIMPQHDHPKAILLVENAEATLETMDAKFNKTGEGVTSASSAGGLGEAAEQAASSEKNVNEK